MFSEKSLQILWQNLSDPDVMKTRRSLCNPFFLLLASIIGLVDGQLAGAQSGPAATSSQTPQVIENQRLIAQAEERPVAPTGGKPRTAAAELKRARDQMIKHSSIRARIVEQVTLADKSYRAEGRYLQLALKPGDWQMRMELAMKVGESEGSLLEVCNGTVLWTLTQIDAGGSGKKKDPKNREMTLTRRNVQQILDEARKSGDFSEQTESDLLTSMGLGGLPALLTSLEQDMKLGAIKEETLRDRPVLVISGTWSEAVASRMRRPGPGGSVGLLPPTVPDQVRLYLDKETGFPYRLLYLKKVVNRDVLKPMLVLDFRDVVLNEPIPASEFDYTPPQDVQPQEVTNLYIEQFAPKATGSKK